MTPLVSILIPAFNAEPWIAATLRSALAQTWPRREIIVVDDGSRDGTLAVARQFASAEVTVVTQPNAGAAAARNHALRLCHGDYVQWLDADDLLAPEKITQQLAALTAHGTRRSLVSCGWGSFTFQTSRASMAPTDLWQTFTPAEWLYTKLATNAFMMNACWLVSRELTEEAGPWDDRLSLDDDGEYFARVLLGSDRILFVPLHGCFYRKSGTASLSNVDGSARKLRSLCHSLCRQTDYLRWLENTPRTRTAALAYLQRWLVHFYPDHPDLVDRLQSAAHEIGGTLAPPQLRNKYAWLRPILGWRLARQLQSVGPALKHSCLRRADHAVFLWDRFRPDVTRDSLHRAP